MKIFWHDKSTIPTASSTEQENCLFVRRHSKLVEAVSTKSCLGFFFPHPHTWWTLKLDFFFDLTIEHFEIDTEICLL